jgi:hypothetical protein
VVVLLGAWRRADKKKMRKPTLRWFDVFLPSWCVDVQVKVSGTVHSLLSVSGDAKAETGMGARRERQVDQ